jgi:hypothetical protein
MLRRYRDEILASTWYGRLFIHMYYCISPLLVKLFGKQIWFKNLWKKKLDKKIMHLKDQGVDNTPYVDKKWK